MFETIAISVIMVVSMIGVIFLFRERFVITGVVFLTDDNIVATVENSTGQARDFIGPKPEWRGVFDQSKPPKRLCKQLDNTYAAWIKYHDY